jgi:hypothetical protein
MRPNQNKRMRGRNNNSNNGSNRKGPNPLSRTYESNGPDVKIRGTAHHIGEKYLQLARDAQTSGDPVMAESFLQHAEHYFRLIAAAQAAQQQAANGFQRPPGEPAAESEEPEDDDDFVGGMDRFASPIERAPAQPHFQQPQPNGQPYPEREPRAYGNNGNGERQPYERHGDRQERGDRPERGERQERGERHERGPRPERNFHDRQDRPERNFQDRNQDRSQDRPYQERAERPARDGEPRGNRGNRGGYRDNNRENGNRYERENRAGGDEIQGNPGLPAFITAPVRIQADLHPVEEQPASEVIDAADAGNEGAGFHLRPRRRRRTKAEMGEEGSEASSARDPVGD